MTETTAIPPTSPPTDEPPTTPPPDAPPPPPLFVRPREGRMLAGVCAGIAERFSLDVTLVRIIAVVLAVASGIGVAAYVAGWLLTPSIDGPAPLHRDSPTARRVSGQVRRVSGRLPAILLIVVLGLAAAAVLRTHWVGLPLGLVAVLVAIALVVGSRIGRWILGLFAALVVAVLIAVGVFGPHLGNRSFHVTAVRDLRPSYDYPVGKVSLDLTRLTTVSGDHETNVHVGRGDVTVLTPPGVPVVVHAEDGVGSMTLLGHSSSGIGLADSFATDASATDRIVVNVHVGVGSIDVRSG